MWIVTARENMCKLMSIFDAMEDALLRTSKQTKNVLKGDSNNPEESRDTDDEEIESSADEKSDAECADKGEAGKMLDESDDAKQEDFSGSFSNDM
ncbi:unnamed protein product [Gongylonema pulchrum]|uniref:Ovule protein n=1 Tax=Gongylonema pulchrum TaxID=637853 RepID=A0A183DG08_9BILA|nr:unnamed protein product [Gongylonema pulchrum]